jgi:hypothetical protein
MIGMRPVQQMRHVALQGGRWLVLLSKGCNQLRLLIQDGRRCSACNIHIGVGWVLVIDWQGFFRMKQRAHMELKYALSTAVYMCEESGVGSMSLRVYSRADVEGAMVLGSLTRAVMFCLFLWHTAYGAYHAANKWYVAVIMIRISIHVTREAALTVDVSNVAVSALLEKSKFVFVMML